VEEVNLRGIKTSGASGDEKVNGGIATDSGLGGDLVSLDLLLELEDVSITEDKSNLFDHLGDQTFEFGDQATVLFSKVFEFFFLDAIGSHLDDLLDEGLYYYRCLRSWR
jgi:hypothetical protein